MNKPKLLLAIDCLQAHDRDSSVDLIRQELREAPADSNRFAAITRLAREVGEIDLAIESAKRQAEYDRADSARQLAYLGELARAGRADDAMKALSRMPKSVKKDPSVRHFRATILSELGDFEGARKAYRKLLSADARVLQSWFALAMLTKYSEGDKELSQMEGLLPVAAASSDVTLRARFLYALGKAWSDAGDLDRSFHYYNLGSQIMRGQSHYQPAELERITAKVVAGFTPENIAGLKPSQEYSDRPIFVTGLPRSGTTLVEQLLATHSAVSDGAEVALFKAAAIPADFDGIEGARTYESRHAGDDDPWGAIGRSYLRMLDMRFGESGRVVDKTLIHSQLMGLILHSLPNARVIWLRRRPEDCALSCYRTFFTAPVPWSWSFADIGHFFRLEDWLFEHWLTVFPDRILALRYEDLVSDPGKSIKRILAHAGLEYEEGLDQFHKTRRSVRTASVHQVRQPISKSRIGAAESFKPFMRDFEKAYYPGG